MESEIGSEWRAPVLHDAITACFFSTDVERALMILRKILERGADANCRDSYGNSSLDRAILDIKQFSPIAATKGLPVLRGLLRCGADPHASGNDRQSVDRYYRGDEAYGVLVRALGSTENWQSQVWRNDPTELTGEEALDQHGRTSLITAAICGSTKVLLHLLRMGADPNRCDAAGWTALGLARWSFPISELLLKYGADPNQPQGDTGLTAFSRAFYEPRLAELMLRSGADPATRNTQGKTFAELKGGR